MVQQMDPRQLAKYPFLKEASELVRSSGVSIEDVLRSSAFSEARRRGLKRVTEALREMHIPKNSAADEGEVLMEVLSYPLARMLISCVNDEFLIRRYATAEAKNLSDRLGTEELGTMMLVAAELRVSARLEDEVPSMHFTDFLRYTAGVRGKEWKLVNQEVHEGYVPLSKNRFARVLEQALGERIENELPLAVNDTILEVFRADAAEVSKLVEEMRERFKANDMGEVSLMKFPPCMKKLVAMAEKGENMPHAGRFAMTSFLAYIGMGPAEIVKIFARSPDFDESKTLYQIHHINGEGGGTKYTPPECATMRTNGVCYEPDSLCNSGRVRHPLTYYRIKTIVRAPAPEPEKVADTEKKEEPPRKNSRR
jgi:DNA primase large subunit